MQKESYQCLLSLRVLDSLSAFYPRQPIGRKVENIEYSNFVSTLLLTKLEIKVSDVMGYLKVSSSTAGRILMQLTQEGHLKKIGKGSATCYIKKPEQ